MKKLFLVFSLFFILMGCKASREVNKTTTNEEQDIASLLNNVPTSVTINQGEYVNLMRLTGATDENAAAYHINTSVIDTTSLDGGEHKIVYTATDENGVVTTKEIVIKVRSLSDRLYTLLDKDMLTPDDYLEAKKIMYEMEGVDFQEDPNFGDALEQFSILFVESFFSYNEEDGTYPFKDGLFYEDEDFIYLNEDKEVIIMYKNLSKKDVIIPEGVKVIGFEAFTQTEIESVDLPISLETIESNAFKVTSLSSLYLPENVKEIGIDAFDYFNISDLTISPENQYYSVKDGGLLSKDGKIFYHMFGKHTDYTIPMGVTVIARRAFSHRDYYADALSRLTNVTIPNSVVIIGEESLEYNDLTNLTIPDSVKAIGRAAFYYNKITKLSIPDSVVEIWPYAFYDNEIDELILGTGVKEINDLTFTGNNLSNIIIPEGVVSIKGGSFASNPTTSVSFSSTVESVGITSFNYQNIERFDINEDNQFLKIQDNGLLSNDGTVFYALIGSFNKYSIPDGVTTIYRKAFAYLNLTEITIPDSVTKIEGQAFYGNRLRNVTIPQNVTEIEDNAFLSNPLFNITIEGDEDRFNDRWTLIGFPSSQMPNNE